MSGASCTSALATAGTHAIGAAYAGELGQDPGGGRFEFRLADGAGLLRDPALATSRMRTLLALHGIDPVGLRSSSAPVAEHVTTVARAAASVSAGMAPAVVTAAMPVAVARAACAPSSSIMRCSNIVTVGLEKRP